MPVPATCKVHRRAQGVELCVERAKRCMSMVHTVYAVQYK